MEDAQRKVAVKRVKDLILSLNDGLMGMQMAKDSLSGMALDLVSLQGSEFKDLLMKMNEEMDRVDPRSMSEVLPVGNVLCIKYMFNCCMYLVWDGWIY